MFLNIFLYVIFTSILQQLTVRSEKVYLLKIKAPIIIINCFYFVSPKSLLERNHYSNRDKPLPP